MAYKLFVTMVELKSNNALVRDNNKINELIMEINWSVLHDKEF
jgi:hypothetical protein